MSPAPQPSQRVPLRHIEQLVDYYQAQAKPPAEFRIGLEHEKIGIHRPTLTSPAFEGPQGIEAVLGKLRDGFGYEPVFEQDHLIGLSRKGLKVSLEPGGQLEFAGTPFARISDVAAELEGHLQEIGQASAGLDLDWLALGENPFVPLEQIPWMPKQRYRIMREYMPKRGQRGLYMMKATSTVQANIDYSDEEDAVRKMRTAMGVSPIVTALYSNSSIVPEISAAGRGTAMDHRYLEWLDTDPDRCGLLPFVFEPDFSFRRYVEWLLDVPLYFLYRDGQLEDRSGQSFRGMMERGEVDLEDFKLHLTTAFPEVRLKSTIELRGADNTPLPYLVALPALWKGLLYDEHALEAAWKLVEPLDYPERQNLVREVGFQGLEATLRGRPLAELAAELLDVAAAGLQRLEPSEVAYLAPLQERCRTGRSLAREAWELWNGSWNRDPESLIAWAKLV